MSERAYSADVHGLVEYLSYEHNITKKTALDIVRSSFRFIQQSVLNSGAPFKLVEFGTFRRSLRQAKEAFGSRTDAHYVLWFTAARYTSRIKLG